MNIQFLRALAERLALLPDEKFNIGSWQGSTLEPNEVCVNDLDAFHSCGNTACIAGYAYMMPEWPNRPSTWKGSPITVKDGVMLDDDDAFAEVMDMPQALAACLTINSSRLPVEPTDKGREVLDWLCWAPKEWPNRNVSEAWGAEQALNHIVGKAWSDWNREDAIKAINYVLARHEVMQQRNLHRLHTQDLTVFFQGTDLDADVYNLALEKSKELPEGSGWNSYWHPSNGSFVTVGHYWGGGKWAIVFTKDQLPTSMITPVADNFSGHVPVEYVLTILDKAILSDQGRLQPYANKTNYSKEL